MSRLDQFIALWELNPAAAIHYESLVVDSVVKYRIMATRAAAAGHHEAAAQADKVADDERADLRAIAEWMTTKR